jgi:iron(III) transport system substrate-binding protein
MNKAKIEIRPRLRVMAGRNIAIGPGKAELLELLQKTGSITQAAREMKMSYMRAWTLIRMMNRCFKEPVVVTTHGGAHGGGGAALSDAGRKVLGLYRKMDAKCLSSISPMRKQLESYLEVALLLTLSIASLLLLPGCGKDAGGSVVIYTSQDEVYAEPIFREFEKETGLQVRPVYDSEAVKTVGLVNRLLTERDNPQCDVFWNNEEFRTRQLAAHDVFRQSNGWTHLGYRTRRLVINTNFLTAANAPRRFSDATNAAWRGKVALAYPLFGTTATHFHALRQHWGDAAWQNWCRALTANKPFLVDGNSVVVKQVERGEAWIGFTDSDDIAAAQREGFPVQALPATEETLFIPNTVGVIRNCPHPEAAQRLYEYLSKPEVSQRLADVRALEGATLDPATAATGLTVDWNGLLTNLDAVTTETKEIFLR